MRRIAGDAIVDEISPDLIARMASRIYNEAAAGKRFARGRRRRTRRLGPGSGDARTCRLPLAHSGASAQHSGSLGSWPHVARRPACRHRRAAGFARHSALPTFAARRRPAPRRPTGCRGLSPESANRIFGPRISVPARPDRTLDSACPPARPLRRRGSRPLDVPAIREDFPILSSACMASRWLGSTTPPRRKSRRA